MNPKHIGLYFGSFNPIHIGHMAIANYMVTCTPLRELWFIVSPQNPFKEKAGLIPDHHRLEMVHLAIGDDLRFRASNVEFSLPQPNYTSRTLSVLAEKYPDYIFHLIMGADNLRTFHKWHQYEYILENHRLLVYPRHEENQIQKSEYMQHPNISWVEAPKIEVSASFIREQIRAGKDMRHFVPPAVWKYLDENQLIK